VNALLQLNTSQPLSFAPNLKHALLVYNGEKWRAQRAGRRLWSIITSSLRVHRVDISILHERRDDNLALLLDSFRARASSIVEVNITQSGYKDNADVFNRFMSTYTGIRKVYWKGGLTAGLLSTLSSYPGLTDLTLEIWHLEWGSKSVFADSPSGAFADLRNLQIISTPPRLLPLLQTLRPLVNASTLCISLSAPPGSLLPSVFRLVGDLFMPEFFHYFKLECAISKKEEERYNPHYNSVIKFGDLAPLLRFKNISTLDLAPYHDVELEDGNLLDAATAWPNIQVMYLGRCRRSLVTHLGLLYMLKRCPRLRELSLPLAGETMEFFILPGTPTDGVQHASLEQLLIHVPIGANIESLATFLAVVTPNLKTFGTTHKNQGPPNAFRNAFRLFSMGRRSMGQGGTVAGV
jgi:hypothetical protein